MVTREPGFLSYTERQSAVESLGSNARAFP